MDCRFFKDLIGPYLDGELGDENKELLEAHIKKCHSCREDLEETRTVISLVKKLGEEPLPCDFQKNLFLKLQKGKGLKKKNWVKWAGAIAGAIVILFSIKAIKDIGPMGDTISDKGNGYEAQVEMAGEAQDDTQMDTADAPRDMEAADEAIGAIEEARDQDKSEGLPDKEEENQKGIESDTLEVYVEDVCITPDTLKFMAINNGFDLVEIKEDGVVIMVDSDEEKDILYRELLRIGQVKEVGEDMKDGKVRIIIKSKE